MSTPRAKARVRLITETEDAKTFTTKERRAPMRVLRRSPSCFRAFVVKRR